MKFTAFVITAATAVALLSPMSGVSGMCPEGSNANGESCDALRSVNDAIWPSCCDSAAEYCRCGADNIMVCGPDPSVGHNCATTGIVNVSKENNDNESTIDIDGFVIKSGGSSANIALSIVAAASIGVTVALI